MASHRSIAAWLLVAAGSSLAADRSPVGGYGFNWSKPKTAKCRLVTEEVFRAFKACSRDSPGFGEHKPTHACQSASGEWIIYATRAECLDELGTMEANGP